MGRGSQHIRFITRLLVLICLNRIVGSSAPFPSSSQTQTRPRVSQALDSEAAQSFAQLNSPDEEKRRDAVMIVSRVEGDAAASALLSALSDTSPRVRAVALAGLGARGDVTAIPLLATCLAKDKVAFVRKQAAYGLGAFRGLDRTSALVAALKDKEPEVRGAAVVSLGDHAEPNVVEPLTIALADKNVFVRAQAARALGVNGNTARSAAPMLIRLLGHGDDNEVKRQAATALGLIGDRSALPALELAAHESDPYLVEAALEAIKTIEKK